jgi:hypothetical protein
MAGKCRRSLAHSEWISGLGQRALTTVGFVADKFGSIASMSLVA